MRKLLIIFVIAGLMGFLPSGYAFAEDEDGGPALIKLKYSLRQKGISENDITLICSSKGQRGRTLKGLLSICQRKE